MKVREFGSGASTVLMLHGAPSPADDMVPMAEALATQHRVLLPDLPGYAGSPGGDLSYPAVTTRLVAMLRERGATTLHGIVGYSGGVYRGLALLLTGLVEARHLVSLAGNAGFDPEERETFRGFAELVRATPEALRSPELAALMAERMLAPSWREAHPDDVARVASWLLLLSPDDMSAELAAGAESEDLRPRLGQVRARVHARVGAEDRATPAAKSRELVALVSDGRLEVVPGLGHAVFIEDLGGTIAWTRESLEAP
ncbi:MAG: alpha/beta hydrolase [Kofleriaceae bacterium]|nr:alpha/beta hydrolase [Kofleriaceae bacterium]